MDQPGPAVVGIGDVKGYSILAGDCDYKQRVEPLVVMRHFGTIAASNESFRYIVLMLACDQ